MATIRDMMRDRYAGEQFQLCFEVAFGGRRADAIVVDLWGRHEITGFEFKASRQDWLNELDNPPKADTIKQYCDYWYLVVTDKKIIEPSELPYQWGLMVPTKADRLRIAKRAEPLIRQESKHFWISILKKAKGEETTKINTMVARQMAECRKQQENRFGQRVEDAVRYEISDYKDKAEKYDKSYAALETVLKTWNIMLGDVRHPWAYTAAEIGLALKRIMDADRAIDSSVLQLDRAINEIKHIKKRLEVKYEGDK